MKDTRVVQDVIEWRIVAKLLKGIRLKQVAREENLAYSTIQKVKCNYPLFFYKKRLKKEE